MSQIPSLISDLAVILISAGLVTLLFKWLKQPVVLGSVYHSNTDCHEYRKYPYLGGYRRNLPLIRFRTRL